MPPADLDCRGRYLKLPIHVAMVNGDDGAEGTEGHPVKTLARAAALVKTLDISERQKTPRRACEPFGGRGPVPVIQSNGSAYESLPVIRMHCSGNGCRMVTCSHPGCCDQLCGKHGAGVGYFMDIDNCDGVRPISMQDYENLARYGASHDYNESVFVKFLEWSQNCIVDFCDAWYCDRHDGQAPQCESCLLECQISVEHGGTSGIGRYQLCPGHANKCTRSYESIYDDDAGYHGESGGDSEPTLKFCGLVCCPGCRHVGEGCCHEHAKSKYIVENMM